ncbi:MAG: type II secretion system F family protein, partial [Gammaproteobacteria bacterium]|nr:type II secretion system F family protein [Gammaproteobacteria bacterium]
MPHYHYKGRANRGDSIEGVIEAASANAVAEQLFNTGITPIEINEHQENNNDVIAKIKILLLPRPGLQELILFSRQMYTLTKAGIPLSRAVSGLAESNENQIMAEALRDVVSALESGRTLSSAMNQHPEIFSHLFISMMQVGENTGRLDDCFLQLSSYLELEKETRERIKSALRYPSFVLAAITAAMVIINMVVIPAFAKVFKNFNAELPWATKLLLATSEFMLNSWPFLLAGSIALFFGIRNYLKTDNGRYLWDKYKLKIPATGPVIRKATLGRFARSFAVAVQSGVPVIQGLTVVASAVDNDYIAEHINQIRNGIERGETLTRTAAATGMFTPLV